MIWLKRLVRQAYLRLALLCHPDRSGDLDGQTFRTIKGEGHRILRLMCRCVRRSVQPRPSCWVRPQASSYTQHASPANSTGSATACFASTPILLLFPVTSSCCVRAECQAIPRYAPASEWPSKAELNSANAATSDISSSSPCVLACSSTASNLRATKIRRADVVCTYALGDVSGIP